MARRIDKEARIARKLQRQLEMEEIARTLDTERKQRAASRQIWECDDCGADLPPDTKRCTHCGSDNVHAQCVFIVPAYIPPDTEQSGWKDWDLALRLDGAEIDMEVV